MKWSTSFAKTTFWNSIVLCVPSYKLLYCSAVPPNDLVAKVHLGPEPLKCLTIAQSLFKTTLRLLRVAQP